MFTPSVLISSIYSFSLFICLIGTIQFKAKHETNVLNKYFISYSNPAQLGSCIYAIIKTVNKKTACNSNTK